MHKQKFFRGHRVKIADKLPESMDHFEAGCEAIVDHSGSERDRGGGNIEIYGLLLLTKHPHYVAWYEEDQLTLIDSDRDVGEEILQRFTQRRIKRKTMKDIEALSCNCKRCREVKKELLVLNETFEEFRYRCKFRKYYQQYTNGEFIYGGKSTGKDGVDFGAIKCIHPKSTTGWCKGANTAKNCPRLEIPYV